MLAYLNLTLFSALNISEMKWIKGLPPVNASNVIAIMVFTSTIVVPPVILTFFWFKRNDWNEAQLKAKVGTFLEGTRHDKDHQITFMVMQSTFFLRRFILAITLVFWQKFVWGQLALQYLFSEFLLIFIQWVKPLESRHANNMATFDEYMTINILIMIMYFSEFVNDPTVVNDFGVLYILFVVTFAVVHMAFLYYQTGRSLYLRAYWAYYRRWPLYRKYKAKILEYWEKMKPCREKMKACWAKVRTKLCKKQDESDELSVIDEESDSESESELETARPQSDLRRDPTRKIPKPFIVPKRAKPIIEEINELSDIDDDYEESRDKREAREEYWRKKK